MDYPKRLHLKATDPDGYSIWCGRAYDDTPETPKVEHVECIACLRELLKSRQRHKKLLIERETIQVFIERNGQIEIILHKRQKEYYEYLAKMIEAREARKAQEHEKAEARRRARCSKEDFGPRTPYGPLEFSEHAYSGDDYDVPRAVLDEARHRNRGTVDCDEFTEMLRLRIGRNLEDESRWFLTPTRLAHRGDPEEYWDL